MGVVLIGFVADSRVPVQLVFHVGCSVSHFEIFVALLFSFRWPCVFCFL